MTSRDNSSPQGGRHRGRTLSGTSRRERPFWNWRQGRMHESVLHSRWDACFRHHGGWQHRRVRHNLDGCNQSQPKAPPL